MSQSVVISSQEPKVRLGEVDVRSTAQIATLREKRRKLNGNFRPYFKTTRADSWAYGNYQVVGVRTELLRHGLDRLWKNPLDCPSPTRMDRRDSPVFCIRHQDGQTIGGADRQRDAWLIGDDRIAFSHQTRGFSVQNFVGMNLPEDGKVRSIRPVGAELCAKAVLEPGDLFEHLRAVDVSAVEAKQLSL